MYDVRRLEPRGASLDYVRAIKYMYYGARKLRSLLVVMGLHQGSTHSPFLVTNTTYPRKSP